MKNKFVEIKAVETEAIGTKTVERLYRYALGEACEEKKLYFMGINPNKATLKGGNLELDKTIELVQMIADNNPWIMLNIFPERMPEAECLPDVCDKSVHLRNLDIIRKKVVDNSEIIAMWGDNIDKKYYFINCLKDIVRELEGKNITWKYIAKTKKGNPTQPIYYKYNGEKGLEDLKKLSKQLTIFRIEEYINNKN